MMRPGWRRSSDGKLAFAIVYEDDDAFYDRATPKELAVIPPQSSMRSRLAATNADTASAFFR